MKSDPFLKKKHAFPLMLSSIPLLLIDPGGWVWILSLQTLLLMTAMRLDLDQWDLALVVFSMVADFGTYSDHGI